MTLSIVTDKKFSLRIVTDIEFSPELGKCYEIHCGKISFQGSVSIISKRIKVIPGALGWIDLKVKDKRYEGSSLKSKVKAYREMTFKEASEIRLKKLTTSELNVLINSHVDS